MKMHTEYTWIYEEGGKTEAVPEQRAQVSSLIRSDLIRLDQWLGSNLFGPDVPSDGSFVPHDLKPSPVSPVP
jgi:hypothetical protein